MSAASPPVGRWLRRLGKGAVLFSFLLAGFTGLTFLLQPDRLAAFTVMPVWLWGCMGILTSGLAWYFARSRFSLPLCGLWIAGLLLGADEARPLRRIGVESPQPGLPAPDRGRPVLRVATLNCATGVFGDPSADLASWQPDLVLLQDILPFQAQHICSQLYGPAGSFQYRFTNAILTRGKFLPGSAAPAVPDQHATVLLPSGTAVRVVNVHLASAATDLRLWRRSAWTTHRNNRVARRRELALNLEPLSAAGDLPVIFGGDFNAPATDVVFRQLRPRLIDAWAASGTGWGDTFQRRLPILRIDHLFTSRHFTAVRSRVVPTRHSDHRLVIADFVSDPPSGR